MEIHIIKCIQSPYNYKKINVLKIKTTILYTTIIKKQSYRWDKPSDLRHMELTLSVTPPGISLLRPKGRMVISLLTHLCSDWSRLRGLSSRTENVKLELKSIEECRWWNLFMCSIRVASSESSKSMSPMWDLWPEIRVCNLVVVFPVYCLEQWTHVA